MEVVDEKVVEEQTDESEFEEIPMVFEAPARTLADIVKQSFTKEEEEKRRNKIVTMPKPQATNISDALKAKTQYAPSLPKRPQPNSPPKVSVPQPLAPPPPEQKEVWKPSLIGVKKIPLQKDLSKSISPKNRKLAKAINFQNTKEELSPSPKSKPIPQSRSVVHEDDKASKVDTSVGQNFIYFKFYYFIYLFFIYLMTKNFVYLFFIYLAASIF